MNNFEPNSCPPCPSDESIFFNLILGTRYENTKENCLIFLNNYSRQIFYSKREIFKILIKELTLGEYSNKEIGNDESIYLIRQLIKKYSRNNIINALYDFVSEKENFVSPKDDKNKNNNDLISPNDLINKNENNKKDEVTENINISKKKENNNKDKEEYEKEELNNSQNQNKNLKFLSKKRKVLNLEKSDKTLKFPVKGKSTKNLKNSSNKKKENKNIKTPIEKYFNNINNDIKNKDINKNSIDQKEIKGNEKIDEGKNDEDEKSFHIEKINKNIKDEIYIQREEEEEEKDIVIEDDKEESQIQEIKLKNKENSIQEKSLKIKEEKKDDKEECEEIIKEKADKKHKDEKDKNEKEIMEEEKKNNDEEIQISDEIKEKINNTKINKSKSHKPTIPEISKNEKSCGHKTKVNPKRIFNVEEVVKLESSGETLLNNSMSISSINSLKSLKKKSDNNNGIALPYYSIDSQINNSSEEQNENEFRSHLIKIKKNSNMIYSYKIRKYGGPNNSILFFECNNKKCIGKGQYDTVTRIFTETEKHSLPFNVHKLASMYNNAKNTLLNDNDCNGYQLLKDSSFIKDKKVDLIK